MSRREAEVIALDDHDVERRRQHGELVPLPLDATPVRPEVVSALRRAMRERYHRPEERESEAPRVAATTTRPGTETVCHGCIVRGRDRVHSYLYSSRMCERCGGSADVRVRQLGPTRPAR